MAIQLTVSFSSLLVEHEDFVALYQRGNHFTYHFRTFYGRKSHGNVTVFVYLKNLFKLNRRARLGILHVVNEQLLSGLCFELLAVDFYNCVHYIYMYKLAPSGGL